MCLKLLDVNQLAGSHSKHVGRLWQKSDGVPTSWWCSTQHANVWAQVEVEVEQRTLILSHRAEDLRVHLRPLLGVFPAARVDASKESFEFDHQHLFLIPHSYKEWFHCFA